MANITLAPLSEWDGRNASRHADDRTVATWNPGTGGLTVTMAATANAGNGASIVAGYDVNGALEQITAQIAGTDQKIVGRINRLLDGTGAPYIQKYTPGHGPLDGLVCIRFPGQPIPLPATLSGSRNAGTGTWTWHVGPVSMTAPAAPRAKRAAPTTPRRNPAPAPVAAPPIPTPSAPIAPPRPRFDPAGLLRFYPRATTPEILTDDLSRRQINAAWDRHVNPQRRGMSAMLFVGPAGTGKTGMIERFAADHDLGILHLQGYAAASYTDWVGTIGPVAGKSILEGLEFIPTPLMRVIDADGEYAGQTLIVFVDEFNRAESIAANNFWMGILQEGRAVVPEWGRVVDVNPNIIFVFAMNEGAGYSGSVDTDTALRSRMTTNILFRALTADQETTLITTRYPAIPRQIAQRIVTAANGVRAAAARGEVRDPITTRHILNACDQIVLTNLTPNEACMSVWAQAISDDRQRNVVVMAINAAGL